MGFANSTFGSKNRTSVLYDFSIVQKAVFYVFHKIEGAGETTYALSTDKEYGGTGILYAQINPYELKLDSGQKIRLQKSSIKSKTNNNYEVEEVPYKSLSMELIYDVYDEHMVGTLDGMLTGVQNIDLTEKDLTSLPALVELSRQPDDIVFFKWGAFEFLGRVKDVDFTYKAFSRFGFPLKAVGTVTLISEGDQLKGDGSVEDGTKNRSFKEFAIAKGKIDTGMLYAEMAGERAYEEILGVQALRKFL